MPPPPPPSTVAEAPPSIGTPCGALGCLELDSPKQAFELVLREDPLVVAVGEAHAQRGTENVPSTVRRFWTEILPLLSGRAKDLVIELVVPDKKCRRAETDRVRERTKEVSKAQAKGSQNEFVTLGFQAKKYGIRPVSLVPTCEELAGIVEAGEGDIHAMLALVAEVTARETIAFLSHGDPERAVVTYGGLLHNDLEPRPGRESWSFGPRLDAEVGGRYVEVDLIVPEYVKGGEPWRSFDWFPHYDGERQSGKTVLFRPAPKRFVLIFPSASARDPAAESETP
jgi:hypothetical protein